MDNNGLLELQQEDPIEIEVVQPPEPTKYEIAVQEHREKTHAVIDAERERRKGDLAEWAEKQRLISNAPPTVKQLRKIHAKLRKGYPLIKALKKVCSVTTWNKWKDEYPEIAALEEQAKAEYVDSLLDLKMQLANQPNRTKMGEIARDKIYMDELQNRIDRIDRLTEIRNKKNSAFGGNMIPIQINVGYGKKNN